jgi:ABC-type oligopeptide transport system ATPase subunit
VEEKAKIKKGVQPLLRVENLTQTFKVGRKKEVRAVDGVSFEIKKGEAFGLVGESGSGKTTTGRSIVGLYELTDGEVYFKGELIRCAKRKGEKRKGERIFLREIQMIFQDPVTSLNPRMTVREIVGEGLKIGGEKDGRVIEEKVNETLRLVGLIPEHAGRYPHEFSGGQRQRIGIARAIVMQPEMIIADEPVSALDVSVQAQVINLLNELKTRLGLTVLFIAHDLSVVKYFSDRIAVMHQGKLMELATADELFKNPLHPYTVSLFSAIPLPDPKYERARTRVVYDGAGETDGGEMFEISDGHFVRCKEQDVSAYKEKRKPIRKKRAKAVGENVTNG